MIEQKTTPPGAPVQRARELGTVGGPVELRADQLAHVAGGGFILSERTPTKPPETSNGFILSE